MQPDEQKTLAELGIDKASYHELLDYLIIQVKESIEELHKAISLDDFDQAARTAHALKGMAGNLRIEKIQTIAKSLELGCKNDKNRLAAEADVDRLKEALSELEQHMP
ncbi:MAG: Hpt domain-containing protein [bacterium]